MPLHGGPVHEAVGKDAIPPLGELVGVLAGVGSLHLLRVARAAQVHLLRRGRPQGGPRAGRIGGKLGLGGLRSRACQVNKHASRDIPSGRRVVGKHPQHPQDKERLARHGRWPHAFVHGIHEPGAVQRNHHNQCQGPGRATAGTPLGCHLRNSPRQPRGQDEPGRDRNGPSEDGGPTLPHLGKGQAEDDSAKHGLQAAQQEQEGCALGGRRGSLAHGAPVAS